MIRVVVAEDSLTVSELLIGILESDPDIRVIGKAKNGTEAVDLAVRLEPDLITMDVHMPVMDGFEATKEIMIRAPTPILVVSSSASGREVELSLNAIRAGALMVVAKPENPHSAEFNGRREHLVSMVKAMAQVKVVRRVAPQPRAAARAAPSRSASGAPARVVAVVASTGGPAALQRILAGLPGDYPTPMLVVQHIAHGFVAGLADWLSGACDLRVKVAAAGEPLVPRTVFLAPDDRQLGVTADGRIVVADTPPVNGFRPSGTHLFTAVAQAFGPAVTAVILTGMGSDGVDGLKVVKAAGGRVFAQDEASSVVYGMPREAAVAGVVDEVLGIDQIAAKLAHAATGSRNANARLGR
jgi:two-component system chemotaxis response regulator CheB